MGEFLRKQRWSPYLVGTLIGILSWFTFYSAQEPIGVTGAFENTAALLQGTQIEGKEPPKINWEWMFVIGIFGGAFISSRISGDKTRESIPPIWRKRFGDSVAKRYIAAFAGGALMMFGARMAQGCTSGHMISGALQFAASSWIFAGVVFVSGVLFSKAIYGRGIYA